MKNLIRTRTADWTKRR